LAEELENKLGIKSDLVKSGGGVFEVEYQGNLVFSKKQLGRFPDIGEVLKLLKDKG
jgi:selenoprotein W-related protein